MSVDVAEVVSQWTGIPMTQMLEAEAEKLLRASLERRPSPLLSRLLEGVLREARRVASEDGKPVLVNAVLAKTDFRKGSISI